MRSGCTKKAMMPESRADTKRVMNGGIFLYIMKMVRQGMSSSHGLITNADERLAYWALRSSSEAGLYVKPTMVNTMPEMMNDGMLVYSR